MTLAQNGSSYDGVKVTVAPIGGATAAQIQERLRVADAIGNNPPALTQAQLYNDLIFVNNLRQVAVATILYAGDNDEKVIVARLKSVQIAIDPVGSKRRISTTCTVGTPTGVELPISTRAIPTWIPSCGRG